MSLLAPARPAGQYLMKAGQRPETLNPQFPFTDAFDLAELVWIPSKEAAVQRRVVTSQDGLSLERTQDEEVVLKKEGQTVSRLSLPADAQFTQVYSCTFLAGNRVAVGATELYLFDATSGQFQRRCRGHVGEIWALSPSPDSHYLLSASNDHTLRIWKPCATSSSIAPMWA